MDADTRQKILAEAKATLATKDDYTQPALPPSDPLERWRAQSARLEEKYKQGALAVREEEAQRRREAEANPLLWDEWFQQQLRRHLPRLLDPSLEGVALGVGELVAELR